jgi:hypothetical protein
MPNPKAYIVAGKRDVVTREIEEGHVADNMAWVRTPIDYEDVAVRDFASHLFLT